MRCLLEKVYTMSGTMDIYGFNISDDDEEEFHPGTDDNDTDKENDKYVSI